MDGGRQVDENPPAPGGPTIHHRRRLVRSVACLAALGATMLLGACSGGGGDAQGAAGTTSTTATVSAPLGSSTTGSGSEATTPGSAKGAAGATRPVSAGGGALPFEADTNPDVSNERDGNPVLVSVTTGRHDGYVRYVFLFNHSDPDGHQPWRRFARPAWNVRWVGADEVVHDGSGDPVANVGAPAHLAIRFDANMHDGAEGQNTLQTSVSDEDALDFGGDFEGRVSWFYGSERERPFRVFHVGDGRVAVDIAD